MIKYFLSFFVCFTATHVTAQNLEAHKEVIKLMGCRFEMTAVATTDTIAWNAVQAGIAEIQRIELLISSWDKNSQTSAINAQAGIQPVVVDRELFDLIYRTKKIAQLTKGAFDISFASMERIWKFDQQEQTLPDSNTVQKAVAKVNWQNIILDSQTNTVFLQEKGMRIGFGAIGKGYAANRAKQLMQQMEGVQGGLVNASGDLLAWGHSKNGELWPIQIADPKNKERTLGTIKLNEMAIVTSGDYEKYFTHQGKRYAHIINPRTGYPTTEIKSVTVLCPDAELADALATSVFVLGSEQGLHLINQLNQIECLIVTTNGELLQSNNVNLKYTE